MVDLPSIVTYVAVVIGLFLIPGPAVLSDLPGRTRISGQTRHHCTNTVG